MQKLKERNYYIRHDRGGFFKLQHGSCVFVKTPVDDQDFVDHMHKEQGVSISEVKAAELCGMCNNWSQFEELVGRYRNKLGSSVH